MVASHATKNMYPRIICITWCIKTSQTWPFIHFLWWQLPCFLTPWLLHAAQLKSTAYMFLIGQGHRYWGVEVKNMWHCPNVFGHAPHFIETFFLIHHHHHHSAEKNCDLPSLSTKKKWPGPYFVHSLKSNFSFTFLCVHKCTRM